MKTIIQSFNKNERHRHREKQNIPNPQFSSQKSLATRSEPLVVFLDPILIIP